MPVRYVHEFLHVCQKIILGREWYTLYEPKECGLSIFLCWKAFTTLRAKSQSILVFVSCNLCIHIQTLDLKRCEIFDKRFARKYELWKHIERKSFYSDKEKDYACSICSRAFTCLPLLRLDFKADNVMIIWP